MKHAETTAYKFQNELVRDWLNQVPWRTGYIPESFTDVAIEDGCIVFREPLNETMGRVRE